MFHVPRNPGNHPRIVLGLLAAVAIIGGAGATALLTAQQPATASEGPAELPARPPVEVVEGLPQLAAHLRQEADAGRFMGAVLVARGGEILFREAYGTANVETGRALRISDRFRLASVSKQFTAAAILKLQDDGRLSVDDPVCRWIQPCPAEWATMQIGHLISHASGIPDLMARPGWGQRRVTPATLSQLTEDSKTYRLYFEPGTKVRYNNAGFNLASEIVEKASGQGFADYLRTAFFDPLGMKDTGFDDESDLGIVTGHANFASGLTAQRNANVSIVAGAGALYSTLDDMLVWEQALHTGHVLKPYSYAAMIADHSPADQPDEKDGRPHRAWGYGLMTHRLGQRVLPSFLDRQIYHTGSWAGFRNIAIWEPEQAVAVIVLTNNYHQQREVFLISQQAMAEALGHDVPRALAD